MGYRKAAMMRRHQYVGGHYRRSKKGKMYWVSAHSRNAPPDFGPTKWPAIQWGLAFAVFLAPLSFGLSILFWWLLKTKRI